MTGSTRQKAKPARTIPLPQAARRLGISYAVAYNHFLKNRLKGWFRNTRILVTVASVENLKKQLRTND